MIVNQSMTPITTAAELDAAVAASHTHPVILFKHSLTCGTSGMAAEEMTDLDGRDEVNADIRMIVVQTSRDVSGDVERRFKVRHESPQVLILHNGEVVWHASHFRVTADAVNAALAPYSR
jgi:bacillithiol system protein YtxJ